MATSVQRALRTAYHVAIAVLTAIPTIVPLLASATKGLPYADKVAAVGAAAVAWAGAVALTIGKLEDLGILPVILGPKPAPKSTPAPATEVPAAPTDVATAPPTA